MTSQTGKQVITIHILPNISGNKGNHTLKFGQLVGYKITNIFLKTSYTKCGGKGNLRPFYKK